MKSTGKQIGNYTVLAVPIGICIFKHDLVFNPPALMYRISSVAISVNDLDL